MRSSNINSKSTTINPESRLVWELTLPAGAEKTLKYRYSLLAEY